MEQKKWQKDNEGCEVRTRADKRPVDLKSTALDHSANPPERRVDDAAVWPRKHRIT